MSTGIYHFKVNKGRKYFEQNTQCFENLEFRLKRQHRDDNHLWWLFLFFPYVWAVTKRRKAEFKKLIMMRSNSNYDIITINCNIMVALFILQIPTIILCTQCKTCSIDHCIGLAIEKYGCLAMKATAVYVILMSLKIIPNKIFLYVCYITIARIKWINK